MEYSLEQMLSMTYRREPSFRLMIQHLQKIDNPLIIETGCVRPGDQPWSTLENSFKDDGMSTCIFDRYIAENNGEFHSVDLTPAHVDYARSMVSEKTQVHCDDSVRFLWEASRSLTENDQYVDLLYLDSFDFTQGNEAASMAHHIKEFAVISSRLKSGTMIAVDDTFVVNGVLQGKGVYLAELMDSIGAELLYQDIQFVWRMP